MKKLIILLLGLFVSLNLFSQFNFGPKAGYSTSRLSTDIEDIKESIRHNLQVGAFIRVGKKLYFQPEIYYATSGGSIEFKSTGLEETIKLQSIGVPLLVGYKLLNIKVFNFRIFAGPAANFIVNKSTDIDGFFDEDNFKDISWGIDIGTGLDIFFLTLDFRYEFGLNNLYIPTDSEYSGKMNSNLFIISLGFKLL
ncbi:MAG: PorT family protein [Bacteroidales bacterium]|nr:PorT family protein [Bacteroidales bacterium]